MLRNLKTIWKALEYFCAMYTRLNRVGNFPNKIHAVNIKCI